MAETSALLPTSARSKNDSTIEHPAMTPGDNSSETEMNEVQMHCHPFEMSDIIAAGNSRYYGRHDGPCAYKFQLEKDVQSLQKELQEEKELHSTLEGAIDNKFLELTTSHFPRRTIELLSTIAALETTVSELEEEIVSLSYQLSQERNERKLAEYRLLRTFSKETSSPLQEDHRSLEKHTESYDRGNFERLTKEVSFKGLWNQPNRLSEEMVRCMRSIFISFAESAPPSKLPPMDSPSSPHAHVPSTPSWSLSEHLMVPMWMKSPQIDFPHDSEVLGTDNVFDPYKVSGKLSWVDIGRYGLATEVSWMAVGKRQLEYAAGSLRRYRILVEQLARVNPIQLSCDEKLAFWINLYNALIMHVSFLHSV
uniref:Ternary complex factor MIP1 leucine-zipper domain-containing protein n=1 Tax=Opuntia streptacantha TaxID=393608 RepID=A0A7C9E2X1_OPUST